MTMNRNDSQSRLSNSSKDTDYSQASSTNIGETNTGLTAQQLQMHNILEAKAKSKQYLKGYNINGNYRSEIQEEINEDD